MTRRPARLAGRARLATGTRLVILALLLGLATTACSVPDPTPRSVLSEPSAPATAVVTGTVTVDLDGRPFTLHVPDSYTPGEPRPLLVVLHGYGSSAAEIEDYFHLAAADTYLVAVPNGTVDSTGQRFWNATDACCNVDGASVDDSTYLSHLISAVSSSYAVSAVFLLGHSNGGFMAHRMACEHADQITAIASFAGVLWADPARCTPSRPVSVVQLHGTRDSAIHYDGGIRQAPYPSAEATVAQWRSLDDCAPDGTVGPARNLDATGSGSETTPTSYACADGTRVALWRMDGSDHKPPLTADFLPAILAFFAAL